MEMEQPIPLGPFLQGHSLSAMAEGEDKNDAVDLRPLEQALGYQFFGRRHAIAALTLSSMRVSAMGRKVASESYERLEFLKL